MMLASSNGAGFLEQGGILISADQTPERAWASWLAARLAPTGLVVHRAETAAQFVLTVQVE